MRKAINALFEKVKIRHFLIIFLVSLPISAYLLRQNNLTMIELRDRVLEVDEQTGDINQVEPYLEKLGNYILTHMNTNAGSIELPGTFNAAVEQVRRQAEASGNIDSDIYTQAQAACEDPSIPLTARAQCVQDFIVANAPPGTDIQEIDFPDKSLFTYSFVSPAWSPDPAGFSVLITTFSFAILVFLVLTRGIARLLNRMVENDPLE